MQLKSQRERSQEEEVIPRVRFAYQGQVADEVGGNLFESFGIQNVDQLKSIEIYDRLNILTGQNKNKDLPLQIQKQKNNVEGSQNNQNNKFRQNNEFIISSSDQLLSQQEEFDQQINQNVGSFSKFQPNQGSDSVIQRNDSSDSMIKKNYKSAQVLNSNEQQLYAHQESSKDGSYNIQRKLDQMDQKIKQVEMNNAHISDNKIKKMLSQMVQNSNTSQLNNEQINNLHEKDNQNINYLHGKKLNLVQETEEIQRQIPPPIPETLPLTQSEIANLKQKQRQSSVENEKESKQKKILCEIAHFYRQLAKQPKKLINEKVNPKSPKNDQKNLNVVKSTSQRRSLGISKSENQLKKGVNESMNRNSSKELVCKSNVAKQLDYVDKDNEKTNKNKIFRIPQKSQEQQPISGKQYALDHILKFSPVELGSLESKLKNKEHLKTKQRILNSYLTIEEQLRNSSDERKMEENMQIRLLIEQLWNGIYGGIAEQLRWIRESGFRQALSGLQEVIELSDQYEIICRDLRNVKSNNKLVLLQDLQMRVSQKLFFSYLFRVRVVFKKEVQKQLKEFEQARDRVKLTLAMKLLSEYTRTRVLKKKLLLLTKSEINLKLEYKIFEIIRQKSKKNIFFRPMSRIIRDNRRKFLKQSVMFALFTYTRRRHYKMQRDNIINQINNSHLTTKTFLILKAFSQRRRTNNNIHTMTANNISFQYINKLQQVNHFIRDNLLQSIQLKQKKKNLKYNQRQDKDNSDALQEKDKFDKLDQFDNLSNKSGFSERTYDSKQFEKKFVCMEEYLGSARQMQGVQRDLVLQKLSRIKIEYDNVSDQSYSDQDAHLENNSEFKISLERQVKQIIIQLKQLERKRMQLQDINGVYLLAREKYKINFNDIREHKKLFHILSEGEKKFACVRIFTLWRSQYLEQTLLNKLDKLRCLRKMKQFMNEFQSRFQTNKQIVQLSLQLKGEQVKYNIFSIWKDFAKQSQEISSNKIRKFHARLCLHRMEQYVAYKRVKRVADAFNQASILKKTLTTWYKFTQINLPIRKIHRKFILITSLKLWQTKFQKRNFLKKFFAKIIYTPQERINMECSRQFCLENPNQNMDCPDIQNYLTGNFLSTILSGWRQIVIDNEHTKAQKLASHSAIQHRKVFLKTRIFFVWIKHAHTKKAFTILFNSLARSLARKILNPWYNIVESEKKKINNFRLNSAILKKYKCFAVFKRKYFQPKTLMKRMYQSQFLKMWKQVHREQQYALPQNKYNQCIVRKAFTGLMLGQLHGIKLKAKRQRSTEFFMLRLKEFMSNLLTLWHNYVHKRKSKNLLKKKLLRYSCKNLKKRVIHALKYIKIISKLKRIQNAKATEFHRLYYQKKYNLVNIVNSPYLFKQRQHLHSILQMWRTYTLKNLNIAHIQQRIQRFHQRKILSNTFQYWFSRFNQIQIDSYSRDYELENALRTNTLQSNYVSHIPKHLFTQKQDKPPILLQQTEFNALNKISNITKYNHKDQNRQQDSYFNQISAKLDSLDQQTELSPSHNFSTSQTLSSKKQLINSLLSQEKLQIYSPKDRRIIDLKETIRKTPNQEISPSHSLKEKVSPFISPLSNKSTLQLKKQIKSVRFEFDPNSPNPSSAEFFDLKYNENETFYQKLISNKRHNTTYN